MLLKEKKNRLQAVLFFMRAWMHASKKAGGAGAVIFGRLFFERSPGVVATFVPARAPYHVR